MKHLKKPKNVKENSLWAFHKSNFIKFIETIQGERLETIKNFKNSRIAKNNRVGKLNHGSSVTSKWNK